MAPEDVEAYALKRSRVGDPMALLAAGGGGGGAEVDEDGLLVVAPAAAPADRQR